MQTGCGRCACRRNDAVTSMLDGCSSVDDFVAATAGIIDESEVRARHRDSPNFGQFRMVIANRVRGEIARARRTLSEARRAARGPAT